MDADPLDSRHIHGPVWREFDNRGHNGFLVTLGICVLFDRGDLQSDTVQFFQLGTREFFSKPAFDSFVGLILFVAYVVYLRATLRSIGTFGMILVAAVFAAMIWVLVDYGILTLQDSQANAWIGIALLSLVLGIGLSWSFVRRAISGQYDVDDADD